MSCNLEQALAKVEKLLKFSAIQKNIPFEIRRIEFEIKAMMSAKDKMLNGPEVLPYDNKLKKTSKKATPEFDTLPKYLPGQNSMTYAGIGSRETPMEVLELMTKASAWLGAKGYTLQSGGAIGADMAFEGKAYPKTLTAGSYDVVNKKGKVVLKAGQVVKIGSKEYTDAYYAFTDKSTKGSIVGSDWSEKVNVPNTKSFSSFDVINNKFGNANKVRAIANELHPFLKGKDQWVEALMARNTYQIFGSNLYTPVDFVLFYAKEGESLRPEGGTGQAVEMARLKGIPTVNMADENWRAKLQEILSNKKLSNKETVKNAEVKPTEDEKIKKPDSGYKTSETESALDDYLTPDLTLEASTKSEDSIINVEKVGKQSTKDKLNLLLKAYDSASGITIGGGYVENMQVKDGYRVSDMDEDVKKGTIEKGMYQESVADLLPKLEKRVSTYLKSYDKYYNELNRTTGVRRDIEYLLDILDKVSSEPYIADAVGIKVEEDVLIQEDTPINELIKDGIYCKNKG